MKITLEQRYRSYSVFYALLEQRLPIALNLKFRNLVQQITPFLHRIENIQASLVNELGYEKDEEGSYVVEEEEHNQFLAQLEQHLQELVELNWDKLSIQDIADTQLSMKELEAISFLFYDLDEMSEQSVAQTA